MFAVLFLLLGLAAVALLVVLVVRLRRTLASLGALGATSEGLHGAEDPSDDQRAFGRNYDDRRRLVRGDLSNATSAAIPDVGSADLIQGGRASSLEHPCRTHPAAGYGRTMPDDTAATDQPAFVSIWHWFSPDQAIAAATLSRRCADLERNPPGPSDEEKTRGFTWSEAAQREHRSFAIASIMSSVAFMEACINELFASARHDNLEVGGNLPSEQRLVLTATAEMVENNRLLDRFQLTLHLLSRTPFDRGAQPFQDAQLLVHLRNELVHYKPRWRPAGDESAQTTNESKLTKGLAAKHLSPNPFAGPGNPFFPDKCLGHGCTEWALRSAVQFSDTFFSRIGVRPVHQNMQSLLVA